MKKAQDKKEQRETGIQTIKEHLIRQRTKSLSEVSKRKRKGEDVKGLTEEEEEKLNKTRKIGGSPTQSKEMVEDRLEKFVELVLNLQKEIKDEIKDFKAEIKDFKTEWRCNQEEWNKEKKELERRLKQLENKEKRSDGTAERIEWLEGREETRERRERRNNIVIKGEEIPERETALQSVEEVLKKHLQIEVGIQEAFWIRKELKRSRIVAKLSSWEEKRLVMNKKNKLKGKKLFIDNDLTKKERDIQKNIQEQGKTERENGARVKIGYKKMQINDKYFVWKDGIGLKAANGWSGQKSGNFL